MRVFVLDKNNKPLMPCTPTKAKKLLKRGLAEKQWSKFGTFGIKLKFDIGSIPNENQTVSLGYDPGTKFEGFSVASHLENQINIKLDLPSKSKIVDKMTERRTLRRSRRQRNTRHRLARFNNRTRKGFIAPSQTVIVNSRLRILEELFRIYPISVCGVEDVKFNHSAKRWGKNFSTCEVGKSRIYEFLESKATLHKFPGFETKELREKYGYKKISNKSADVFEAHNCDSLAMACEVNGGMRLGPFILVVVDDTYRFVRRKLHDSQPAKGGKRALYSKGTVFGLKKGKIVGYKGKLLQLTGFQSNGRFTITNLTNRKTRNYVKELDFVSNNFNIRSTNSSPT